MASPDPHGPVPWSPQGSLRRDPHTPRIAWRAGRLLDAHHDVGTVGHERRGTQAQNREASPGPAGPVGAGRLAHDEATAHSQERGPALSSHRWPTERPGADEVEGSPQCWIVPGDLGPGMHDPHPAVQPQRRHRSGEEGRPPCGCLKEGDLTRRPPQRKDQPRHTTAATQVDQPTRWRPTPGPDVCVRVLDVGRNRPGAEKPRGLRPGEDGDQLVRHPRARSRPGDGVPRPPRQS
jgi:hypothetical protein